MTSLLAQLGYDGIFVANIDYQDMRNRKEKNITEVVWEGSPKNLGKNFSLLILSLM